MLPEPNWSLTHCRDNQYRTEFAEVVRVLNEWLAPYGGFEGKDLLDFGCGEGTAALGIALQHKPNKVVGIDPGAKVWKCLANGQAQLGLERLPENLKFFQIEPDAQLSSLGTFDIVYSWSVFEHLQQDWIVDRLKAIRGVLRPNGVMFLQTTPLYYSAWGAHFRTQLPVPWAHLSMQESLLFEELRKGCASADEANFLRTQIFETLNKATAPGLLRACEEAGFQIVRKFCTCTEESPPSELIEIFHEEILTTEQLVFLAVPS